MRRLPALLLVLASAAGAQPAWSELTPAVGAAALTNGALAPWEPGAGLVVRVEAPAYGGRVRAEAVRFAFATPDGAFPPFTLLVPTVGWGPTVDASPLRIGAGARVGVAQFAIDDDTISNFDDETELAAGGWLGWTLRLGRAELWAEGSATRLTLSEPTTLVVFAGGLAVRLDTPGWLRGVLE